MSAEVKLRLMRQGLAQSYYFEGARGGWASCVVNDATGELMIQSDWGAGAYRWNTAGLGVPTLTEFIAQANADYLARKLLGRDGMERFDAAATTRNLFQAIIARRRNDRVDRAAAREAWDALIDATLPYWDAASYWAAVPPEVSEIMDPGEFAAYEASSEARAFKGWILPALIDACKVEVERRALVADNHRHPCRCDSGIRFCARRAADLFIAIQATDGQEEHDAICDGARLAATIDAALTGSADPIGEEMAAMRAELARRDAADADAVAAFIDRHAQRLCEQAGYSWGDASGEERDGWAAQVNHVLNSLRVDGPDGDPEDVRDGRRDAAGPSTRGPIGGAP